MKLRKKFAFKMVLACLLSVLFVIGCIHVVAGLAARHSVQFVEITYASPKINADLNGYTIAFVTDMHDYNGPRVIKIIDEIRLRDPNLLLLGGDFCRAPQTHLVLLGETEPPDGIYGVGGNHDDPKVLFPAMRDLGMRPLDNAGVALNESLYLAGVNDLRTQLPDTAKAMASAPPNAFVLLLSHNPALVMEHDVNRADLVLAGHTHGGQWNFFGAWSPALFAINKYGNRFRTGWCKGPNNLDVYVSNGIGSKNNLLRIFAPKQVIYLTLKTVSD